MLLAVHRLSRKLQLRSLWFQQFQWWLYQLCQWLLYLLCRWLLYLLYLWWLFQWFQ